MRLASLSLLLVLAPLAASAQTMGPSFSGNYAIVNLGSIAGVPQNYGGLTFENGNPNVILIGGDANEGTGAIYAVNVLRDANNTIIGFNGSSSFYAAAPNIDGGLAYAPNGTLFYTTYSNNTIGQILPGNTSAAISSNLTVLGVASSTGSLGFVPAGFPGAGRLLVGSYTASNLYNVPYSANGNGTYTLSIAGFLNNLPGGIEGLSFVDAGNPAFANDTLLVSEYDNGQIVAYPLDASGNLSGNSSVFVSGLTGAEGAAVDPLTGDFLFSSFGTGGSVFVVSGFTVVPEPATAAPLIATLALGLAYLRKKRIRVAPGN
jgi:hypothetical protein